MVLPNRSKHSKSRGAPGSGEPSIAEDVPELSSHYDRLVAAQTHLANFLQVRNSSLDARGLLQAQAAAKSAITAEHTLRGKLLATLRAERTEDTGLRERLEAAERDAAHEIERLHRQLSAERAAARKTEIQIRGELAAALASVQSLQQDATKDKEEHSRAVERLKQEHAATCAGLREQIEAERRRLRAAEAQLGAVVKDHAAELVEVRAGYRVFGAEIAEIDAAVPLLAHSNRHWRSEARALKEEMDCLQAEHRMVVSTLTKEVVRLRQLIDDAMRPAASPYAWRALQIESMRPSVSPSTLYQPAVTAFHEVLDAAAGRSDGGANPDQGQPQLGLVRARTGWEDEGPALHTEPTDAAKSIPRPTMSACSSPSYAPGSPLASPSSRSPSGTSPSTRASRAVAAVTALHDSARDVYALTWQAPTASWPKSPGRLTRHASAGEMALARRRAHHLANKPVTEVDPLLEQRVKHWMDLHAGVGGDAGGVDPNYPKELWWEHQGFLGWAQHHGLDRMDAVRSAWALAEGQPQRAGLRL